jgi:hypothetical protein
MEDQLPRGALLPSGPFTTIIGSLLVLSGIVGVAVGIAELALPPGGWGSNLPRVVPILGSGSLDLLGGTALGFGPRHRAIWFLALALACRVLWHVLAHRGWLDTGGGLLELVGLLLAFWLRRRAQGAGAGA